MDRVGESITTSAPTGLVPAAIRYEATALCETACTGVTPIVRRPVGSRSNYRSGVIQDDPLPGVMGGRDFVTGVTPASGSGMTTFGR